MNKNLKKKVKCLVLMLFEAKSAVQCTQYIYILDNIQAARFQYR